MADLRERSIEARLYFPPAHRQPIFHGERRDLPVTDWLADHLLSLPFHAKLGPDDLDVMVTALEQAMGRLAAPVAHH
jgi:perosamine synthetase